MRLKFSYKIENESEHRLVWFLDQIRYSFVYAKL